MSDNIQRSRDWICIAWPPLVKGGGPQVRGSITKKLSASQPITEKEAMRQFRKKFPKLRDHTVQPA